MIKPKQIIKDILHSSYIMQVATSHENIPWVCTVCFAYDSSFNLYWFSRNDTRHSREIRDNSRVAAAIAVPYTIGDKSRGLQIDGIVTNVHDRTILEQGLQALQERYDITPSRLKHLQKELLSEKVDYGLYCLSPEDIVIHDSLHFPESPRKKCTMNVLFGK